MFDKIYPSESSIDLNALLTAVVKVNFEGTHNIIKVGYIVVKNF